MENNPNFNGNIGKYNLPHIWDVILNNAPEYLVKTQWVLQHLQAQEHH